MAITTILFDVDGTLLDTREFIYSAFEHALTEHGIEVPSRERLGPLVGEPLEDIYELLAAGRSPGLVESHRTFQSKNLHLSIPFPGTVPTLARLKDAGFAMAAVTSRSRRTSLATLEQSGLSEYLPVVISAEDAPALKPDPAPLIQALAHLRRHPHEAVMVGDTPHDIAAGRAAGTRTIGALYGFHHEPALRAANPDALIGGIGELEGLLGRLG